ncbi:hypothetical protein HDV02_000847, partial [Globomyces sp. JEL0801]
MQSEPNKEGLLKLLKTLKKTGLYNELSESYQNDLFDAWKNRSKEDWEKYYGLAGIDIYNYLHPKPKGILVENTSKLIAETENVTLWKATGVITGARKMGFRRGLYQIADGYLGFYEKCEGVKQNPFYYKDGKTLMINVLFENKSEALHFRSAVYRNVDTVSPNGDLVVSLKVVPVTDAVLDETILVGHFEPDEDSLPDTPRPLSGVTELYDTSPLFQYQRLEDERWFAGLYKADRAHLIDKPLCEKGQQFAKFKDNDNNFLALSKQVHWWFDGVSNVSSNPESANDYRYRVLLIVEAYNVETARLFFPRLKDGSTRISDTQ